MRIMGLFSLAMVLILTGPTLAQAPSVEPVGTMSQLMVDIILPTSDDIFYIGRTPPSNNAEWGAIQRSALMLAESGNLLMVGQLNTACVTCHQDYRPNYRRRQ